MGNGLRYGGEVVIAQDQIAHSDSDPDSQEADEQGIVFQQEHVPQAAGHAQAAPLSQSAYHQSGDEGDQPEGPHGAGAFFRELQDAGHRHQQHQQNDHHTGEHQPLALADGIGPAQGEALFQKDDAHQDTCQEAQ